MATDLMEVDVEETNGNGRRRLTSEEQLEKQQLAILAEIGGKRVTNEDIIHTGKQIVLPEGMSIPAVIKFLRQHMEAQEKETEFSRVFKFRPWDGAHAVLAATRRIFGTTGIGKGTWSFFGGYQPPQMISIPISLTDTVQVPWGEISMPVLQGTMEFGYTIDSELGQLFKLSITAPKKFATHVEGLFQAIGEELRERSIYKGRAIYGSTDPTFLDQNAVHASRVIYSDEVITQLGANVFTLLEQTRLNRELGLPLKRSVLLEGPYGTGKSLAALLTAQKAVKNGWTFIFCRPNKDDLSEVMATARLYQPSVVFFEDVDAVSTPERGTDAVSELLDMFDGITAKGTELVAILTTNHAERIHKGMVRPGRLDAVIHIGALDTHGVQRMIEATVRNDLFDNLDYDAIGRAMDGYMPAFVKEAIDRAQRYAIGRERGRPKKLTTDDFVHAANGLRDQLRLMEEAQEDATREPLTVSLTRVVDEAVDSRLRKTNIDMPRIGETGVFVPAEK